MICLLYGFVGKVKYCCRINNVRKGFKLKFKLFVMIVLLGCFSIFTAEASLSKVEKTGENGTANIEKTMTLKGTIVKTEVKTKDGKTKIYFYLVKESDGKKVALAKSKAKKIDIELNDLIDKKVIVIGTGTDTDKAGKKIDRLKTITSIEIVKEKS